MCASRRLEWEHFRGRRGCAGVLLWRLIMPPLHPDLAHRMDLSSRCHGSPHSPPTPRLWQSGPAAEKPLPRDQALPPTYWYINKAEQCWTGRQACP